MNAHQIEKIVCNRCHALLDVGDNYCRHCGAPTVAPAARRLSPTAQITHGLRPAESRLVILIMLFAVLGPLALPMLWRSPNFSRPWKVLLTLLVLVATVAVFWLLVYVLYVTIAPFKEILGPEGLLSIGPPR